MGREPCEVQRKGGMLQLWNRLINMPDNRLTKQVFCWNLLNKYSWTREIAEIFDKVGLQYVFRNILPCNVSQIKTLKFEN